MGTINWLVEKFKTNDQLIVGVDSKLFDIIGAHIDTSINNLMYQAACHFTFYHKLAHLVQKSAYLSLTMEENPQSIDNLILICTC